MNLEQLKDSLPEFAKDTKLNLNTVLSESGSPGLSLTQIWGIALCAATTIKDKILIETITHTAGEQLNAADIAAAKAAASLMAMNNIYYRFLHLVNEPVFREMPTRLRMNFMANPGVAKIDFELYGLTASILNGCGACMETHTRHLFKLGVSAEAVQSTARIAAVINAASNALCFD